MSGFLAMLKDSFREAVDGWIFAVMLGLAGLLILLVASSSAEPLPAEPLPNPPRDKARKKALIAERALSDLQEWLGVPIAMSR